MLFNELVENYDFSESALLFREKFKEHYLLKDCDDDKFNNFSKEYWSDPKLNSDELKVKYSIPQNIRFYHILMAYPMESYFCLLKKFYKGEMEEDDFISAIKLPLVNIECSDGYCPQCYNDLFSIEKRNDMLYCTCNCCNKETLARDLLTFEKANEKKLFFNALSERLKKIPCPMCQSELTYNEAEGLLGYVIRCKECRYESGSIQDLCKDYVKQASENLFTSEVRKEYCSDDTCIKFLQQHYPLYEYEDYARDIINKWYEDFNHSDIIRALTVTVDKIKKEKIDDSIETLLSYTRGVLNYGTPVRISKFLINTYHLEKWE